MGAVASADGSAKHKLRNSHVVTPICVTEVDLSNRLPARIAQAGDVLLEVSDTALILCIKVYVSEFPSHSPESRRAG